MKVFRQKAFSPSSFGEAKVCRARSRFPCRFDSARSSGAIVWRNKAQEEFGSKNSLAKNTEKSKGKEGAMKENIQIFGLASFIYLDLYVSTAIAIRNFNSYVVYSILGKDITNSNILLSKLKRLWPWNPMWEIIPYQNKSC